MTSAPGYIGPGRGGDEDDLLAAEYVLGTLPHADRLAAEARASKDAGFAAIITKWEHHFAALNDEVAPLPAPDLLPRIEARLFGKPARREARDLLRLVWLLAGGSVAAIVLIGVVVWQGAGQRPPPQQYAATLEQQGQKLVFSADWNPDTRELQVTRTAGPDAGPGHDYELWLIGKSGVPISLGLLRGHDHHASVPSLAPGAVLAVSLEPSGGSRSGQPTGPVLVKGVVARL